MLLLFSAFFDESGIFFRKSLVITIIQRIFVAKKFKERK